ncbi:MAG: phage portal protein [Alkalilacustris sp.]
MSIIEPVTASTHPVVLRFAELFPAQLAGYEMHGDRSGGDLSHIDSSRSALNRMLIGPVDWREQALAEIEVMRHENLAEELAALKARGRSREMDARIREGLKDPWRASKGGPLREVILTANKDWFEAADAPSIFGIPKAEREMEFEHAAVRWLRERFGDDVIHARADHDERTCHIHAIILPREVKQSKRRGRQQMLQPSVHPLIKDYEAAQDDVGAFFAAVGLRRGERRAEARRRARAAGQALPDRREHIPPARWRGEGALRLQDEAEHLEGERRALAADAERVARERAELNAARAALAEARADWRERIGQGGTRSRDFLDRLGWTYAGPARSATERALARLREEFEVAREALAARRVMARQVFETLTRGYDGAARGRRTEAWRAPGSSADTEIGVSGALLRDRMRDLVRNNPHAAKAVAVLVNNIIGAGIMPRAASGDEVLDRRVDDLFERWTEDCDADGQLDFYGLQTLICREMVEAGEVLVRRRLRRSSDGLPVPLQLQVLEADFLDATKSGALGAGRLVQGIEFDPVGKRRAYWLHAEHPGDAYGALQNGLQSRPVPATEIAHVYEKQRTQARGVPWGAPVIRSLRDLDDYEVAELVRKKTEACVTAIVFGDDEAQQGIAPSVVDADGNRVEQFEPGLIAYARGGKDIRFNQPSATGGYGEYKRASLHTISAGFRVPYELLTGDLSQVNYSSIRAGLVEFRRQIDAVQWQLFIPMFCAPVWRWFTEAAWAAGQIPSPTVPVEWSPPKFEAVDPQKDAMANLLSIRSGTMTLAEVIAKQGRNPDAVLAEIAATNAKLDALGLVLDSDPRRVTKTGSAQVDVAMRE